MRARKVQPGNPHRLTINQHVFPRSAIQRFSNAVGKVEVELLPQRTCLTLPPTHNVFCAQRAWDEKAERQISEDIEAKFNQIGTRLVAGEIHTLPPIMQAAVTDMYLLWTSRFDKHKNRQADVAINGVTPERNLTQDSQEHLEKNHVLFIDENGTIHGHRFAGIRILMDLDRGRMAMQETRWGVIRSARGEFIAPDNFAHMHMLPISPTIYLAAGARDAYVDFDFVAEINNIALESAHRYYFARDLLQCPVHKRTVPRKLIVPIDN